MPAQSISSTQRALLALPAPVPMAEVAVLPSAVGKPSGSRLAAALERGEAWSMQHAAGAAGADAKCEVAALLQASHLADA